jgi:hypothetical protein
MSVMIKINNIISSVSKRSIVNLFSSSRETLNYPTNLGRWKIDHNESVINRKIDQANEDNCGCCIYDNDEHLQKTNEDINKEKYLIPYCIQ